MRMICDACGEITKIGAEMGGALICPNCEIEVQAEIERLRAEGGKPVNVRHIAKRIFRRDHGSGDWRMQDPPEVLWDKVKAEAFRRNCSMREVVILAVSEFLDRQED